MTSTITLQEKFNAAVKAIQRLPNDGTFQPSNEMKLTFYGLYKQATIGPCNESRPSLFNYVNRAKWDAWDKYRSMSKETAMTAYIDEIRKILETMPQTNEVLEFTQLIGPFYEFVDDHTEEKHKSISVVKTKPHHINLKKKKQHSSRSLVNGIGENSHENYPTNHTNGSTRSLVSTGNGPVPSSSPSLSSSSISSSDPEEFYGDPSDRLSPNHSISKDDLQENEPLSPPSLMSHISAELAINNSTTRYHPQVLGGQNGSNLSTQRSHRTGNHLNELHGSSTHSTYRYQEASDGAHYSASSVASGGGNGRYPDNSYNKETQRAILAALTKLQRDVNNILERLNRLENSSHFLQQREPLTQSHNSLGKKSLSRWFPLAGLRRRAIAFILLWPFVVFALIRLFLRARIIIRFRQPHL